MIVLFLRVIVVRRLAVLVASTGAAEGRRILGRVFSRLIT